jgi:hypothetical protein
MSTLRTFLLLPLLGAMLGACAAKGDSVKAPPPTVEEVLASSMTDADYGKPQRCLQTSQYESIEVLDKKHLLFEGRGGKYWLNTLRLECPGLRRDEVLQLDLTTNRVCNLDTVTAIAVRRFYIDRVSATCSLGEFQPIPKEQAEFLLKEMHGK